VKQDELKRCRKLIAESENDQAPSFSYYRDMKNSLSRFDNIQGYSPFSKKETAERYQLLLKELTANPFVLVDDDLIRYGKFLGYTEARIYKDMDIARSKAKPNPQSIPATVRDYAIKHHFSVTRHYDSTGKHVAYSIPEVSRKFVSAKGILQAMHHIVEQRKKNPTGKKPYRIFAHIQIDGEGRTRSQGNTVWAENKTKAQAHFKTVMKEQGIKVVGIRAVDELKNPTMKSGRQTALHNDYQVALRKLKTLLEAGEVSSNTQTKS
jgi:hypothetical protein